MRNSSARSVVIVDRHRLFADCLCIALAEAGHRCRVRIPPATMTAIQMVKVIRRERPDVVVMSADPSPAWDGLDLIEPLGGVGADVLVVTEDADPARTREALQRGAHTVLPKRASLDTFQVAIRQIALGESSLTDHQVWASDAATEDPSDGDGSRARLQQLTSRENEILGLLMEGNSVSEIALLNVVSEATVRTQVRSVLTKLGVSSQLAAVGLARRAEWPCRPHLSRAM